MEADFHRFCKMHSWYKHIPLEGVDFYVYKDVGEQARNCIQPEINDPDGMHWYFSQRKPSDCESFCVRLGPFLRGIEGYYGGEPIWRGFHIIVVKAGASIFSDWINIHYPHLSHIDWSQPQVEWTHISAIEDIYLTECNRYLKAFKEGYELYKANRNNESV
jgi:hypothetical protein